MTILEQIIEEDRNVEAEDFLNLSQQDKSGMYTEANRNRKKYSRQKARRLGYLFLRPMKGVSKPSQYYK